MPICSAIPSISQWTWVARELGSISVSSARIKTWLSSMLLSPSAGSEARIAGPPVLT
jgi:hypothetical protein